MFDLINEPISAERGKPMQFRVALRDVYNRIYQLDPVPFPWIGGPVFVAPTAPTGAMWQSLADRFKAVDAKPIQVRADWIYTIEMKEYLRQMEPAVASQVAVRMCIELC